MGARTATGEPADNGTESGRRSRFVRVAAIVRGRASGFSLGVPDGPWNIAVVPQRLRRAPVLWRAILAMALAVAFVAGLTYYSARAFSGRAADSRASNEAMSFAEHSSRLATDDAFDGYIQILRYADDPILNTRASSADDRNAAMQRLLLLNTNKFTSLTLVDRSGLIFATTDSTIANVRPSIAFSESRANLAPANTDIILTEAGKHGYVEYSAPLRDVDGTIWGILLGRADPATLWKGTLAAAVDGSRNVIVNSEGLYAAGVPDELLRQPWHGQPLSNGGVRASIAGIDSICGLAPIGKDTQIDRGLNVASCLPVSLIQVERQAATGKQALVTTAGAVLAVVLAALVLRMLLGNGAPGAADGQRDESHRESAKLDEEQTSERLIVDAEPAALAAPVESDPADAHVLASALEADVSEDALDAQAAIQPPPADVDALKLIEAFEQRNSRLAERLRETVQARLLVAATEAGEAFKLADSDAEAAASMHEHAMTEIENVRVRELRAIGQELYPGLTRLGLPGALRAMRKAVGSNVRVTMDLDETADSVAGGASRSSLTPALRLVMYRFALDTVQLLDAAGAKTCELSLRRAEDRLVLTVATSAIGTLEADALAAGQLAAQAHGGTVVVTAADGAVSAALDVPAPAVEPGPEVDVEALEAAYDDEHGAEEEFPAPLRLHDEAEDVAADDGEAAGDSTPSPISGLTLEPRHGLAASIEALQAEFFGSMIVALDLPADAEGAAATVEAEVKELVENLVRDVLHALEGADSRQCDLSVRRSGSQLMLTILSEVGDAAFDVANINAWAAPLEARGGYLAVGVQDGSVAVSAEIPSSPAARDEAYPLSDDTSEHAA